MQVKVRPCTLVFIQHLMVPLPPALALNVAFCLCLKEPVTCHANSPKAVAVMYDVPAYLESTRHFNWFHQLTVWQYLIGPNVKMKSFGLSS